MNLKFYTLTEGNNNSDTVGTDKILIIKVNELLNLYEFSFTTDKKFTTAGVVLQGGGKYNKLKIYKVYLAINNAYRSSSKFISAKK